ncbi:MurR/RpiR family transcriptional regulator [uncultured Tateyamaria sp.]|uniref:MurR/RpiR family transcriptional regulator n=1 Tax=uncultured Tateyamaria sp. TaxID=455651 RepID=UPI002619AD57|nr:MurR/RpiR family transcriptional regulator [uncultured Tateyamaria sp.]
MDPTLKTNTTAALKDGIAGFSPQLRTAAKYIVDHPSDFGLDSIRETARKAQVSTYTFVNLAKILGFASFEAFRSPYRHALVSQASAQADPEWLRAAAGSTDFGGVHADAARNTLSIVTHSLERQQAETLNAIADMLIGARNVYLTAVRSSYAVAYYLHYVGRMALPTMQLIPRHHNSAIDDLNTATEGDVLIAITVTPYSRETIEACAFAKKKGVKLLLITDSEVVSPDLAPEHTLVASVLSTHNFGCFSGMMAVVELLLAFLMKGGGDPARDRIASYEKLRIENNAYWVAQKKH